MESAMETTFAENKLATTVGASGLAAEAAVSQPIKIIVTEEIEYEFDQAKYEEYMSSSSSKSSSPRKCRKISSPKKVPESSVPMKTAGRDSCQVIAKESTCDISVPNDPSPVQGSLNQDAPVLTKRARQRQRQRRARQLAKAMQQTDGVHYYTDLKSRNQKMVQLPQRQNNHISAQLTTEEWTLVKRARSTLKERIQRRQAKAAHARALRQQVQENKKEVVDGKPQKNCRVWVPKNENTQRIQRKSVFNRGSTDCRGSSDNRQHVLPRLII